MWFAHSILLMALPVINLLLKGFVINNCTPENIGDNISMLYLNIQKHTSIYYEEMYVVPLNTKGAFLMF